VEGGFTAWFFFGYPLSAFIFLQPDKFYMRKPISSRTTEGR
jgi:hypothetical protein